MPKTKDLDLFWCHAIDNTVVSEDDLTHKQGPLSRCESVAQKLLCSARPLRNLAQELLRRDAFPSVKLIHCVPNTSDKFNLARDIQQGRLIREPSHQL